MNANVSDTKTLIGTEPTPLTAISRRGMLCQTGLLGGTLVAGLPLAAAEVAPLAGQPEQVKKRLKVVVAGGHPGDPEYGCGGTIARFAELGHEVILLYLNEGDWGDTPAATRLAEAKRACEILKARPMYVGQRNGHAIVDESHYDQFAKLLQAEGPDAVITQWPLDNHRDHRAISMLAFDAWRQSGRKFSLYYYDVSNGEDTIQFAPSHYVDITDAEPSKRAACYAHASQTPDHYYRLQDQVAVFRGLESGYKRAEAFVGLVQNPFDAWSVFGVRSRK
jgi:LmbE family N-acetylglucosaminyl deacetylase